MSSSSIIPAPSLSTAGWITATAEKADKLFSWFFESDSKQSYFYAGKVANIQTLIQQYGNDFVTLCNQIRQTLENYLSAYYQSAVCSVTSDYLTNTTSKVTVSIQANVTEQGVTYSLGALLNISGNTFNYIIQQNNG